MLSHAETGLSARLPRSSGASGRCRGLLQVLLENRTAAMAGPHQRTRIGHLIRQRSNLFYDWCIFMSGIVRSFARLAATCNGFAYDAPHQLGPMCLLFADPMMNSAKTHRRPRRTERPMMGLASFD